MTASAENRVIVAGAGPVGLTLALQLRRVGLPVTVLERRDSVNTQSKASTFHAATLDILDHMGLLADMRKTGVAVPRIQYRAPDGAVLAELDFGLLKGRVRNPYRLHFAQSGLTALLRDRVLAEGGEIRFGAALGTLAQDAEGVTVTAADGSRHRGAVLFGCDGAQSAVREAARIGYVEKPYPGMVLRLYAALDMRRHIPDAAGITYLHAGDAACSLLEMHDCWRIVLRVPEGTPDSEALSDTWAKAQLAAFLPVDAILPHVTARDVYRACRRRAMSAGAGRVFLAGDALHLTNTKGGMNLNAGLHDATALAHATAESLATGSLAPLERAADDRARVARDILIPRTDENVGTGRERVRRIAAISQDKAKATAFLARQAMLDMLAGLPPGLVGEGGRT